MESLELELQLACRNINVTRVCLNGVKTPLINMLKPKLISIQKLAGKSIKDIHKSLTIK